MRGTSPPRTCFNTSKKMAKQFKQDKGVAGLTILLSLVVMLFIIGLLIMIFSIMGSELKDSTYDSTSSTKTNETISTLNDTVGDLFTYGGLRSVVCSGVVVTNATIGGTAVPSTNYTVTNCRIYGKAGSEYMGRNVNVTYTYTYDNDNTATGVMNDTVNGISSTTDWFDIFIVIGAMVVLILLTVIIITAIRGSGMIGGQQSGANTIGTA